MKKKIQVLHVYRTYFPDPPGGLQEAIRQIALATTDYGISNVIFSLSKRPHPSIISDRPEGQVVRCRSWAAPASCDLGGPSAVHKFRQLSRDANLVIYHFPWPFGDILHILGGLNRPSAILYHSDIVRQRFLGAAYKPLMWRTLNSMNAIIATSPNYVHTSPVLSHSAIRDKIHIIPLGIQEQSYPQHGDSRILQRLRLDKSTPFFLFIGALRYYKGLHFLLQAAQTLNAKIIIAGSGPERERLDTLATDLALKNVIFSGHVSDQEKVTLLLHCRALILPSHLRSEAFGMSLIEAAMLGRPLITCEIGTGTSYVNAHGESGLVVPPANPEALANAMESLINNNLLTKQLGVGARMRYEKFFSGAALGQAYSLLFQKLIAREMKLE
ncbi:glycosyltransferase [Desulfobulbus sp.]|uniref:glycosyltransferase n=1 Tax=Desulfobulbus sp. TaxID=895 RepID=UPI0027B93293|nr:glycosyltransferase [Desulfobulbus sp.]